jgi:hypothetical protein
MQGHGLALMKAAAHLQNMRSQLLGEDILIEGEMQYSTI